MSCTRLTVPARWLSAFTASIASFVLLLTVDCGEAIGAEDAIPAEDTVDFNRDVRPLLSNRCFRCHGPDADERQGSGDGLRLDLEAAATADLGGYRAIAPGDSEHSELIKRIASPDDDLRMPPPDSGAPLSEKEVATFRRWIDQGAKYDGHWAYERPQRPPVPPVKQLAWPQQPLDNFVLTALEARQLQPREAADPATLLRRVTLDLIGLPPSREQTQQFLNDTEPGAYHRLVDRLLDDRAFGEHWARLWLDLARYADSAGYADDPPRKIWPYRDYVIRAFNDNKPFDQFTIEQIAGDLLPDASHDQLIATAFHRNTLTNNEGGTNDEEFRNVAIVDRVNTTMAVWMGTTMACAQCHSHKYDPITQEDYFRFFAIFNNTADADRTDESPLLEMFTAAQMQERSSLQQQLDMLRQQDPPAPAEEIATVEEKLKQIKPDTVPIQRELDVAQRRTTKIQRRGNFLDVGEEVTPRTPVSFHPLPVGNEPDRLGLARWLVDANNPLTARVVANRFWEQLFGIGLVATSEDFGSQGDPPTHPELLDWLACELVDSGWNIKAFLRTIVTSATYRQSSQADVEQAAADPDNRWLARGPRFRMSGEMVRDQALAVSGLLSAKMYGPPVRPLQPSLGVNAAFGSGIDWSTSDGEDRYRRAIYTTWRRSNPYPSLSTFDAPNREVCTLRRVRTNTPLQALVTLNDPVYIEAAQALARTVLANCNGVSNDVPSSPAPSDAAVNNAAAEPDAFAARANWLYQRVLMRDPDAAELTRLRQLYDELFEHYSQNPAAATAMATDPSGPLAEGMEPAACASWTVVCNVVLNLDETLMKR